MSGAAVGGRQDIGVSTPSSHLLFQGKNCTVSAATMEKKDNRLTGVKKGRGRRRADPGRGQTLKTLEKRLLEEIRQTVEQTPEVRPKKVAAIKEALEQGSFEIDSRKLANILIAELILKR
jgi:flagellar biosynthesis anti-sigma factor FlgM